MSARCYEGYCLPKYQEEGDSRIKYFLIALAIAAVVALLASGSMDIGSMITDYPGIYPF